MPGVIDGFELALRAVLGQQITVKAATTIFGRFVEVFGSDVETPYPDISRIAPNANAIANATLQQLIDRGLTGKRAATVSALARAAADGAVTLNPPADFAAARTALQKFRASVRGRPIHCDARARRSRCVSPFGFRFTACA